MNATLSFVALVPALAAMLGANVGTTLIVQALSFAGAGSPGTTYRAFLRSSFSRAP
jgi:Na+/phosphate symporter